MFLDIFYPVFRALVAFILLLQPVSSGPVQEQEYLYLGAEQILELPSLAKVSCEQNCPFGPGFWDPSVSYLSGAAAAVVPYGGVDTLMVCGLRNNLKGCYVWRKTGWELSDTLFKGNAVASSKLADGRWLVTGGFWRYDTFYGDVLSTARMYSEADGWVDFSSLPATRYHHCQVTVGNAVYVIGGYETPYPEPGSSGPQSSVFILSDAQEWVKGESLPTPLSRHACAVMGTKIYVLGGHDGNSYETSVVYVLDTSTPDGSWETGPELPVQLAWAQTFVYEGTLYLLGGRDGQTDGGRDDHNTDVYTLAHDAQSWSVVPGSNITDNRFTFPAPFITNDAMHCNQ